MLIETRKTSVGWAAVLLLATAGMPYVLEGWWAAAGMAGCGLGAALILGDYWEGRRASDRMSELLCAPEVEIMRLYASLDDAGRANLQAARVVVDYVLNFEERLERWHIPTMPTTRLFYSTVDVEAVWQLATPVGMAPISTWPEGTIRRECASSMVGLMPWYPPPAGFVLEEPAA